MDCDTYVATMQFLLFVIFVFHCVVAVVENNNKELLLSDILAVAHPCGAKNCVDKYLKYLRLMDHHAYLRILEIYNAVNLNLN